MRKKLLILILLIGIAFMLIGCSMMQPNENADVIDHLDDIQDVLPYILERGGEASYVHISDWFETDYNLDGIWDDNELERSYEEMLLWFDNDHIVTLTLEDVSDMKWCINKNMADEYIKSAEYAIMYYDNIEWFNLSSVVQDDCSEYRFTFTWTTQDELYDELYESFIDEGYDQYTAMDLADSFSSNGIAYNSLRIKDDEEGNYNTFDSTTITFIVDAMTDMLENERDMVALHELSHSFGLDDIYDEDYIGISLMYGVADGQEELIPELTVFDLYNLAYIYNREEGED